MVLFFLSKSNPLRWASIWYLRSVSALRRKLHYVSSFFLFQIEPTSLGFDLVFYLFSKSTDFGIGSRLTRPRPGDGGASRLVPVGDSSPRIVALGFNLVSVCSQNRPTLPQSAAPLGVLPILVLVVVRLGRAPATAASAA